MPCICSCISYRCGVIMVPGIFCCVKRKAEKRDRMGAERKERTNRRIFCGRRAAAPAACLLFLAALLVALVFAGVFLLFILFCTQVWFA